MASNPENAQRCLETIAELGFVNHELTLDVFLKPDTLIRMGVPPLRLELLTSISGVEFHDCYSRREIVDWQGLLVSLIHLSDLKANKAAAGRSKDRDDLENLP